MTVYKLDPPPRGEDLDAMRKKARKRKVPRVDVGSCGCLPGIGEFRIVESEGKACLEWRLADGEPKRSMFQALSRDRELEELRLEVGWLIANCWMVEGRRMLLAIPGPNEAMRESARYFDAARRWRHWAQVPAGHMIF